MATHSSILVWETPWTEELEGYSPGGHKNVRHDSMTIYYLPSEKSVAGQEATAGTGTTDWFHTGKNVCQEFILSPCLFNLYTEYIMRNSQLDEAHAGIKIVGRNINNLIYRRHHPYGRKQRGIKELLDESERGE